MLALNFERRISSRFTYPPMVDTALLCRELQQSILPKGGSPKGIAGCRITFVPGLFRPCRRVLKRKNSHFPEEANLCITAKECPIPRSNRSFIPPPHSREIPHPSSNKSGQEPSWPPKRHTRSQERIRVLKQVHQYPIHAQRRATPTYRLSSSARGGGG